MIHTEMIDYQWNPGPMFECWENSEDLSPEKRLWRFVILLLLQDIQKSYIRYISSLNGKRGKLKKEFCDLLTECEGKWAFTMCLFADIDHEEFLDIVHDVSTGKKQIKISKAFNA